MISTEPYTVLAEIYDCVMKDVPYKKWAKYIIKLIQRFRPGARRIFEFACGTGTMLALLRKYGFIIDGMDFSKMMINKAKEKVKDTDTKLFVGDMSNFKIDEKYEVALCLYDSVNYLNNFDKFKGLLTSAGNLLNDDGIFIFDISTEYNSIQNAILMNMSGRCFDVKYKRKSYYLKDERIHINEFEIELNGKVYFEKHVQRIYKISEIENIVRENEIFEIAGCYNGFSFNSGSEWSDRVHFVLKKREN
ncbi:MAG: methyltransferase domain-containing protein [Candidatus Kryptonium sp.]|nr:methyltransferase domain-containing protein [Candidatus Kryptonium sp.]